MILKLTLLKKEKESTYNIFLLESFLLINKSKGNEIQ